MHYLAGAVLSVITFLVLMLLAIVFGFFQARQMQLLPLGVALGAAGLVLWWSVVCQGLAQAMVKGGLALGALGLVGGVLVGMLSGSNLGPLPGLFISGPLGLILGLPLGAVWWFLKKRGRA